MDTATAELVTVQSNACSDAVTSCNQLLCHMLYLSSVREAAPQPAGDRSPRVVVGNPGVVVRRV